MEAITKKKMVLLVLPVLVSIILLGIAARTYANDRTNVIATTPSIECSNDGSNHSGYGYVVAPASNAVSAHYTMDNESVTIVPHAFKWMRICPHGLRHGVPLEVSEDFKNNVINITKTDPDVQMLLADGYNITCVRPIIKAVVEADGNVVIKVTSATVMLLKDVTGRASVLVDVEEGKVTRIVILTRTVIEKP